jgi:hypothetical protein
MFFDKFNFLVKYFKYLNSEILLDNSFIIEFSVEFPRLYSKKALSERKL